LTGLATMMTIKVEVIPATLEQEPVLDNLLQLYIHDFSELVDVELDVKGRFSYQPLSSYWTDSNRHPFLVWADGNLAGFVFVIKGSRISGDENIWDIAEFFVVRGYRRLGVGKQAAYEIWKKFPGKWEVRVIDVNQQALKFWQRAVSEFVGKTTDPVCLDKDGKSWNVFTFESKPENEINP
jgi:predicted acetyltransferase